MTTEKKTKIKTEKKQANGLLVVIRIVGLVKIKPDTFFTLDRLRMRRKYSCVLIDTKNTSLYGMLKKVKYSVAFGEIEKETLVNLLKARGEKVDKSKFDAEKVAGELISGKTLKELGFKPFFRLHPPRKGINSKLQYPKGVLGYHGKDINKLIERML